MFQDPIPSLLTLLSSCHSFTAGFCAIEINVYVILLVLYPHIVSLCHCSALMEGLVTPLQDRIEEWKKTANQLDKDHAKG